MNVTAIKNEMEVQALITELEFQTTIEDIEFVSSEMNRLIFIGYQQNDSEAIMEVYPSGEIFINGQETEYSVFFNKNI